MGCQASKAADATAAHNPPGRGVSAAAKSGAKSNHSNNNIQTPISRNGSKSIGASSSTLGNKSKTGSDRSGIHSSRSNGGGVSSDDMSTISSIINAGIHPNRPERLYKLLAKALQLGGGGGSGGSDEAQQQQQQQRMALYKQALKHLQEQPMAVKWMNPNTKSTCLHIVCRLVDVDASSRLLLDVMDQLIAIDGNDLLRHRDVAGHIPLHYAIAPTTHFNNNNNNTNASSSSSSPQSQHDIDWKSRAIFVQHLLQADPVGSQEYLKRTDVVFESGDATGACSPLYRALQTLPDDFSINCPTAEYVHVLTMFASGGPPTLVGNTSDGDLPLALLYRRFTRQFDISEKFFAGDNSRPEVLQHRKNYKLAAGTTWKIMEILLSPHPSTSSSNDQQQQQLIDNWGIVHQAVQVETPPDLLRYIVETNAQDLTRLDSKGNLPLHYAAAANPSYLTCNESSYLSFYPKYVIDELLYKFPEAASMQDAKGRFPLTIAVRSGKQWIGGGIKSLYDAYPDALKQIDIEQHSTLKRALNDMDIHDDDDEDDEDDDDDAKETKDDHGDKRSSRATSSSRKKKSSVETDGMIRDNPHDAIMLVQQPDADSTEIVAAMWAHEEDAGVQMLGCLALSNLVKKQKDVNPNEVLRIALLAVAAVVNAMKAHPNEMIVQEKACCALQALAVADGQREISMVASGAVSAIVGGMQAHVGDAKVQEHACAAIAAIVRQADRATVVASVSGVTAILNAIAAHNTDEKVQMAGFQALKKLTDFAAEANLPELPRTQTEPLLFAAQEQFGSTNPEIQEVVSVLMNRMSS